MLLKLYDKGDFTGHEGTTQTEKCDFSDDSPLYTFRKMITAAAAGIARRLQLNSYNACGKAVHLPSITVQITAVPVHSPPAKLGRTPCWTSTLQSSASVRYGT